MKITFLQDLEFDQTKIIIDGSNVCWDDLDEKGKPKLENIKLAKKVMIKNKFEDIFLLTGGASGTLTLPISVYQQGFAISNIGMGSAISIVIVLLFGTSSINNDNNFNSSNRLSFLTLTNLCNIPVFIKIIKLNNL